MITRRTMIKQCGQLGLAIGSMPFWSQPLFAGTPIPELTLYGPPAGPSTVLAHLAERQGLSPMVNHLQFTAYRNPDQLRTGVVSGRWQVSVTPSYVAANLHNKKVPVHLMNIMTWGLLYLVSEDASVTTLENLEGKTILMPFKNDMPDLVFQYIMQQKNMIPGKDFKIHYVSSPFEGINMMMAGRATIAVLPEPAATAVLIQGKKNGKSIRRALSLQKEWGTVTQGEARIPQAGMIITDDLLQKHPELPSFINNQLLTSTEWVQQNPQEAGKIAEKYLKLKGPIIQRSIPFCNLTVVSGNDAKTELSHFLQILAERSPEIIGGKLPENSFFI